MVHFKIKGVPKQKLTANAREKKRSIGELHLRNQKWEMVFDDILPWRKARVFPAYQIDQFRSRVKNQIKHDGVQHWQPTNQ